MSRLHGVLVVAALLGACTKSATEPRTDTPDYAPKRLETEIKEVSRVFHNRWKGRKKGVPFLVVGELSVPTHENRIGHDIRVFNHDADVFFPLKDLNVAQRRVPMDERRVRKAGKEGIALFQRRKFGMNVSRQI